MAEYIERETFERFIYSRDVKGDCKFCNNYERCIRNKINRKGSHLYCWEKIALPIIERGFIVTPCNVGDTVYTNMSMQGWYMRKNKRPYKAKIVFIGVNNVDNFMNVVFENDNMLQFNFSQIGKTVFLTKEDAEAKLKERE